MLQDSELARRIGGKIEIRPVGMRLRWELTELATADGHAAQAIFTSTVRALPEANELRMLEEALLSSASVATAIDVTRHFSPSIFAAAREFARQCDAQNLLADEGRRGLLGALLEAAGAVAFACGVEVTQPAQLDLDCPTLQKRQIENMQRESAQRRFADQVEHIRRSAELVKQFEVICAASPQLSAGQALERITEADRADVFRAVLAASGSTASAVALWAVAGSYLIRIGPFDTPRAELIAMPTDLGPVRSVRGDGTGGLLLGCRLGVLRVNPESPRGAQRFYDPQVDSQLGFNSVLLRDEQIWASHGEAGLVCWNLNEREKPYRAYRPKKTSILEFAPRNLHALGDDRLIFSSGRQLLVLSNGEILPVGEPGDSDWIGIFPLAHCVLTVQSDGHVSRWSRDELKLEVSRRGAGRISAAAALPWLGDVRILLAGEDGPIICIGLDDELVTQFASPYRGLRILAAAAGMVAAVTPDRQRIVLWHAWDGRKPFADPHVYGAAKHRIADLAFCAVDGSTESPRNELAALDSVDRNVHK